MPKRKLDLGGSVLQVFREIMDEKRRGRLPELQRGCVYWRDDRVAERVAGLLQWKRLNERRRRRISGSIAGLINSGRLTVVVRGPHGNRGITLA